MKRHFYIAPVCVLALAAVYTLVSRAATTDPFAADKPKGPVKPGKYEPARGVYLGAALDTSSVGSGDVTGKLASDIQSFERTAGKPHALYLHFLQFPNAEGQFGTWENDANGWVSASQFAAATQRTGATPILTLEPMRPQMFLDWKPGSASYEATRNFAQAAGKWGKPVFIRFAHEMNGSWYPWAEWIDQNRNMNRDPGEDTGFTADDYREAYRNVAKMFRQYAPNAALVWCPNSGLLGGGKRDVFRPWYPGDDLVDWVALDIYERGWNMPAPGAHLWGGQFAHNLTHDMTDDTSTPQNESVNFYLLYSEWKRKPMMVCETSATLSYRTDLPVSDRANLTRDWKIGYWNKNEYGWMQSVYGTSDYKGQPLLDPIDKTFPLLKAVVWFNIAKREYIPAQRADGTFVWFDNEWADYRIGGGVEEGKPAPYAQQEIDVYRALTRSPYYLSRVTSGIPPRAARPGVPARAKVAQSR